MPAATANLDSMAKRLSKHLQKRTGAPLAVCLQLARGLLESTLPVQPRNAGARVNGLRLLADSIGATKGVTDAESKSLLDGFLAACAAKRETHVTIVNPPSERRVDVPPLPGGA